MAMKALPFSSPKSNGADVRVVQSRSGLGFTAKSLQSLAVLG
jgi:hypothetical protein